MLTVSLILLILPWLNLHKPSVKGVETDGRSNIVILTAFEISAIVKIQERSFLVTTSTHNYGITPCLLYFVKSLFLESGRYLYLYFYSFSELCVCWTSSSGRTDSHWATFIPCLKYDIVTQFVLVELLAQMPLIGMCLCNPDHLWSLFEEFGCWTHTNIPYSYYTFGSTCFMWSSSTKGILLQKHLVKFH